MAFTIGNNFRGISLKNQSVAKTASGFGTDLNLKGTLAGCAFGMIDDESFRVVYDVMTRPDMSYPTATQSRRGKVYSEGSINMALDTSEFCARVMNGIFVVDTISGSGPWTHTMVPMNHAQGYAAAWTYPAYTLYVMRDEVMHLFINMFVNRIGLSASVGEYVSLSADFVGAAPASGSANDGAAETVAPPAAFAANGEGPHVLDPIHFIDSTVKFNGGAASGLVSAFDVEFNLNRDVDASYALGNDTCAREPPAQTLTVTGNVEFSKYIHTAVADEITYPGLIDFASPTGENNPSSGTPALQLIMGSGNEKWTIDLYKLHWGTPESSVSGRDTQTMRVPFTALLDHADVNRVAQATLLSTGTTKGTADEGFPLGANAALRS